MGKAIYVSNVSKYTTDRAYNMVRHLKAQNINTTAESEDFYDYCTQYESEAAYAKYLALNDRNKAPKSMDLDLTPFINGRYDLVLEIDGIYAKLEDLEKEIEYHKYEQVLTKMYGNQVTYNDGWICHIGGEVQLSDSQYYNLYKTVESAYNYMLYQKCAHSKCVNYREEICKRTGRIAKTDCTRPQLIKRIKNHIMATMS